MDHDPHATPSLLKTAGIMLLTGIGLLWLTVLLIPTMTSIGIPHRIADRLPLLALVLGIAWGFATKTSKLAKRSLEGVGLTLLTCAVFWFFGVVLGGVLFAFGLNEELADYIPIAGFVVGLLLCLIPAIVIGFDGLQNLRARNTPLLGKGGVAAPTKDGAKLH